MPTITYIEHDGTEHRVEVKSGSSLMQGALIHGIPGIDAQCGGACACATCHIYLDEGWRSRVPPLSEEERDLLEIAAEVGPGSRLACQIKVVEELDGLVLRLPAFQG